MAVSSLPDVPPCGLFEDGFQTFSHSSFVAQPPLMQSQSHGIEAALVLFKLILILCIG
jgi:hypothetical protein